MSVKRLQPESVVGLVPQGPRDMVKAGLPEPQFPVGVTLHPPVETLETRRRPLPWSVLVAEAPSMSGRWPMWSYKGTNGAPTVALDTSYVDRRRDRFGPFWTQA